MRQDLQLTAGQRADPDALSEARIANRQAVVDLINQRRAAAGCTANVAGEVDAAFEQFREPGKVLIRRAVIERVG